MKLIVFCLYREKDRLYRIFSNLYQNKGIAILTSSANLKKDLEFFERATCPVVLIIPRPLIQIGFRIISDTSTEILFSAKFPGGAERVQALGRLRSLKSKKSEAVSHA